MTKIRSTQTKEFIDASVDPLSGPAEDYIQVTKSDSTVFDPPLKAFRVGTAGDVAVTTLKGNDRVIPKVLAGETISLQVTKIKSTGTTASDIGGFI
jgi:hypothetical protein